MTSFTKKIEISNMVSYEIVEMDKDIFYFRNGEIDIKELELCLNKKFEVINKILKVKEV